MMEIDINYLVKEYGNMISTIAHRMIQNKEIAREAAQEVWYELCKSFSGFKGDSEISTWIYTVARRTIGRYAACENVGNRIFPFVAGNRIFRWGRSEAGMD